MPALAPATQDDRAAVVSKAVLRAAEALGLMVALSLMRELGPVVTALLFAGRAGTSLTAEIGLMKATELSWFDDEGGRACERALTSADPEHYPPLSEHTSTARHTSVVLATENLR